jgi:hypothetical protein
MLMKHAASGKRSRHKFVFRLLDHDHDAQRDPTLQVNPDILSLNWLSTLMLIIP